MIQTVDFWDFKQAFKNMDREENFSPEGLMALFDYLEEYEDETDEQIELDVIALCVEYTEYADMDDFRRNYSEDYDSIDDIENETQVIRFGRGSFICQDF